MDGPSQNEWDSSIQEPLDRLLCQLVFNNHQAARIPLSVNLCCLHLTLYLSMFSTDDAARGSDVLGSDVTKRPGVVGAAARRGQKRSGAGLQSLVPARRRLVR